MPRLPRVMVTEGVDAPKGATIPFSAGESGASALAEAARAVSSAVSVYTKLERQKQDVAIKQEAAFLDSEYEREVAAGTAALQFERDPEEYARLHESMLAEAQRAVREKAKNPEAARLFEAKSRGVRVRKQAEAYKHANGLFVERGVAQLDSTLETRKNLAGLATSDEDFRAHLDAGHASIDAAIPLIGADKAGDMKRQYTQQVLGARALAEANANPEAFVESADTRFDKLDAKQREQLKETARAKADSNRKNTESAWEKWYARIDEEAEAERKRLLAGLRQEGEKGGLTVERLDEAKAMRIVNTGDEYSTLYNLATETKDGPSDRDTLDRLTERTYRSAPTTTQAELDAARRAKLLNRKDYVELSNRLTSRSDHLTAERRTIANQEMAQAEQVLKAHSGMVTLFDQMSSEDKYLWLSGIRELTERATAGGLGGTEKAADVAMEIGKRFNEIRLPKLSLDADVVRRTLLYPAPSAEEAAARLNEKRGLGVLSDAVFRAEQRKILDLKKLEEALQPQTTGGDADKPKGKSSLRPKTGTGK